MTTATKQLAYSIRTASESTGFSKTHLTAQINKGLLRARRSSTNEQGDPIGKWVILAADLEAWLAALPEG